MKTIGLIGAMSRESTVTYYQIINRIVQKHLGGFHLARCILHIADATAQIPSFTLNYAQAL